MTQISENSSILFRNISVRKRLANSKKIRKKNGQDQKTLIRALVYALTAIVKN